MTEYIDKQTAIDAVAVRNLHPGIVNALQSLIVEIPSADVVPVRHGRWIKANGSWVTPGGDPVWECSECGKGRHVYGIEHGSYGSDVAAHQWVACPNCGALMDKEEN